MYSRKRGHLRSAMTAVIVAACAIAVVYASMGRSFSFLAPGYAQHVFGNTSNFKPAGGYLGGVVVLQSGDVIASECQTSTTRLHDFSATSTTTTKDTVLHTETILPASVTIAGGCGI